MARDSSFRDIRSTLARRLAALREEHRLSLAVLAAKSRVSRATLSRLERGESSPTAEILGRLASIYARTISQLMVEVEEQPPNLIRASDQLIWKDPKTGFRRKLLSPPGRGLRAELIEGMLPAGTSIRYDRSPSIGLEHHFWMLSGTLELTIEKKSYQLHTGDCFRLHVSSVSRFRALGRTASHYVFAVIHL